MTCGFEKNKMRERGEAIVEKCERRFNNNRNTENFIALKIEWITNFSDVLNAAKIFYSIGLNILKIQLSNAGSSLMGILVPPIYKLGILYVWLKFV